MGGSTLLATVAAQPLTCAVVAVCTAVYAVMWNRRLGYEDVSTSYRRVVGERQFYRVVSATFCHLNLMHLVFNMYGLFTLGVVEAVRGSYYYLQYTVLLILLSEALFLGCVHVLAVTGLCGRRWPRLVDSSAVGYSGVLYGWMTLAQQASASFAIPLPLVGISLPLSVAPFVSLVINQLLIPQASLLGHLGGLLAGLLVSWGGMDWFTSSAYWFWTTVGYVAAVAR
jgi:membrane associated rhomboid family serine protease